MVELNDTASITLDRRQRDQEQAKRQKSLRSQLPSDAYATFSESGEMEIVTRPPPLSANSCSAASHSISSAAIAEDVESSSNQQVTTGSLQKDKTPPADPQAAMRNIRFAAVGLIIVILFVLWVRQRRR